MAVSSLKRTHSRKCFRKEALLGGCRVSHLRKKCRSPVHERKETLCQIRQRSLQIDKLQR
eukprot:c34256_g1_i1 orf=50-229(-)